jgi:hypothetical protein
MRSPSEPLGLPLTTARIATLASLLLLHASLSGCALIDTFASRSEAFNHQASESRSSVVLLNIMRSAYAKPLQFTDISTVTGQGSIGASIGSNLPVSVRGPTTSQQWFIQPGASTSGNTTFSVSNLNTQEFYYGLQTPLSTQLIASYLKAGYNPRILLPLAISEIEVDTNGTKTILRNRADSPAAFYAFYSAVNALIAHGLNAEQKKPSPTPLGPPLGAKQVANAKILNALITTTASDAPTLKPKKGGKYQLEKKGASYFRFCFDRVAAAGRYKYFKQGIDLQTLRVPKKKSAYAFSLGQSKGPRPANPHTAG